MNVKNKALVSLVIVALTLAVLGGCAGQAPQDRSMADAGKALTAERWELIDWSGHEIPHGANSEPVILSFQEGDQASVSGRAWCNRFSAPYVLRDAQRLTIGHAAATRKSCSGDAMEFESAFLDKLQALDHFRIHGETLELQAVGGEIMTLRAQAK